MLILKHLPNLYVYGLSFVWVLFRIFLEYSLGIVIKIIFVLYIFIKFSPAIQQISLFKLAELTR